MIGLCSLMTLNRYMRTDFYVYCISTPVEICVKNVIYLPGDIFYVGKGCGKRYKSHFTKQKKIYNPLKHTVIERIRDLKTEPIVTMLYFNLTEKSAFDEEIKLIKKLGRLIAGTGKLTNLTEGGEGSSGYVPSEKTRKLWSKQRKGRANKNKGIKCPGKGGRKKGFKWTKEQRQSRINLLNSDVYKEKNKDTLSRKSDVLRNWFKIHKKEGPKGKIWVNNGNVEIQVLPETNLIGFVVGRLYKTKEKLKKLNKGKHWYTNRITSHMYYPSDVPEGWFRGRCNTKHKKN